MALEKQILEIPFMGGVEQKIRSEVFDPSQGFTSLQNYVQNKTGAFDKRPGMTQTLAPTTTDPIAGQAMFASGQERAVITATQLFGYSKTGNTYAARGNVQTCKVSRETIAMAPQAGGAAGVSGISAYDLAAIGNYLMVAYVTSTTDVITGGITSDIWGAVYDTSNGSLVDGPVRITSGITGGQDRLRVVRLGTSSRAALFYSSLTGAPANIAYSVFDTAAISGGWSAYGNIVTDANGAFDASTAVDIAGGCYLFYVNNSGGASCVTAVGFTSAAYVLAINTGPQTYVTSGAAVPTALGISTPPTGGTLWLAFNDNGTLDIQAIGVSPTVLGTITATRNTIFTLTIAATSRRVNIENTAANTAILSASCSGLLEGGQSKWANVKRVAGVATLDGNIGLATVVGFQGRNFTDGKRWYSSVCANFVGQYTAPVSFLVGYGFLDIVDISDTNSVGGTSGSLRPVANIAPGSASSQVRNSATATVLSGGKLYTLCGTTKTPLEQIGPFSDSVNLDLVSLDFAATDRFDESVLGASNYLSGGVVTLYDGAQASELGFQYPPPRPAVAGFGAGITGTFSYIAVYEYINARGEVIWSELSPPISTGPIVNQSVLVTVRCLHLTSKQHANRSAAPFLSPESLQIAVYRTENAPGAVYYRVGSIANSLTTDTASIADNITDANLARRPQLYKQPGQVGARLSTYAPPAMSALTTHNGRLMGIDDTGLAVWYSGAAVPGEQPWFSSVFQFPVSGSFAAKAVALASQNGRLVIFGRDWINLVDGAGPADNGTGGLFGDPQVTSTDVGCIEPRSVVSTNIGTFFQSAYRNGIYVLDQSLQPRYIGAAVEGEMETYPVVTSAVLDDTRGRVLFTVTTTNGLIGKILCFDLTHERWSQWVMNDPVYYGLYAPAASAAMVNGSYEWITPKGTVYRADDSIGYDVVSANYTTTLFESGWIKMAGLSGFKRCWRTFLLCARNNNHDLRVSISYDYEANPTQTVTFTAAAIAAMSPERMLVELNRQLITALRVRVEELTSDDPGAYPVNAARGATLIGLRLEYGIEKGSEKLGQAQRG